MMAWTMPLTLTRAVRPLHQWTPTAMARQITWIPMRIMITLLDLIRRLGYRWRLYNANTSPAGTDSDGDGLDDAFDARGRAITQLPTQATTAKRPISSRTSPRPIEPPKETGESLTTQTAMGYRTILTWTMTMMEC